MSEHLDKGESIDESTTASTAGATQWSVAKAEKLVFQVILAVNKTLERPSKRWKIFGRIIVFLQIIGFVVTPRLWHPTIAGAFSETISAFQIPVWANYSHLIGGIALFVIAFLLFTYFALWGWTIRSHSRESVRPWTAMLLGKIVRLLSSAFFIPFLRIFVSHLACIKEGDTNESYILTTYSQYGCFSDPLSVALFVVAILFAFVFTGSVLATDLLIFNPSYNEKFLDNKPTGRFDALSKATTVVMVFAAHFLIQRPVPLVAAFLVYATCNVLLYAFTLPFHMSLYNCIHVGTWAAAVGAGIAALISVLTNYSAVAAILLYPLIPAGFVAGFLLTRLLYKWRIRFVERNLPDPHADEEGGADPEHHNPLRGTYHRRDRLLKEHWPFVFQLEVNTRFLLEDPTPENVAHAERMLLYQCRHFPSAMAEINYVQFLISFKRDPIMGRVRVNRARKLEPTIDERLMLLRLETIFEEERLSDAHGENISAALLADMRKQLQDARRYHIETLKNFGDFWSELVHEKVDLARLPSVMSRIEHSEERADFAFGKLMSKFPTSKMVLRAYAQYLDEVKMDEAAAQEYSAKADMLENIRRAAAVRLGSESHDNVSASEGVSSQHSRGSGGSSELLKKIAASGQALELTAKVQNSSAVRRLRIMSRALFIGLLAFLIVAFALFHADQKGKSTRLDLYSANGNRVTLMMQASVQTRDLQIAAMLAINDTSLLPAVDAAKVTLSETLLRFEYEHKRASIGLDNTPTSDYSAQSRLITDRTITLLQLTERNPPMLQQRLVNIIDGGLVFIENAAKVLTYSLDDLRTMDDDPAFRFIIDNGPDSLLSVFSYSNDLLVEEEEAADASFQTTLIVLLVVFCLVLNVPGFVLFQNVFDGIREERNFALNLFLLIPKTVIRHMLKEKKFQQNTQKNVVGSAVEEEEEPKDKNDSTDKVDKGKMPARPPSPPQERPTEPLSPHSARRQVSFRPNPDPATLAPPASDMSDDESATSAADTHLADSDTGGDRPTSRNTNNTNNCLSSSEPNFPSYVPEVVDVLSQTHTGDHSKSKKDGEDELPILPLPIAGNDAAGSNAPQGKKGKDSKDVKGKDDRRRRSRDTGAPTLPVTTMDAARADAEAAAAPTDADGLVAVTKPRRCAFLRRAPENEKRCRVPMNVMMVVILVSVLIQLGVTIPLLMLPATQTALATQYNTMRTTSSLFVNLVNGSEVSYSREFVETGNPKTYEAYEDFRGGPLIDDAVAGLRKLNIPPSANEKLGQYLALMNKGQHYSRIAIALTLIRSDIKPIRNYLSIEYPWDIMDETDHAEMFLKYPTLKNRYTNRTYDTSLSRDAMGLVAKACISGGPYKENKKAIRDVLAAAKSNTSADQFDTLEQLHDEGRMLATVSIGLVPVFLFSVVVMAVLVRVQVVTHFAVGELPRQTATSIVVLFVVVIVLGITAAAGVRIVVDHTELAMDPYHDAQVAVTTSSDVFFAVTSAMRAIRDFADGGDASNFRSYEAARVLSLTLMAGLTTDEMDGQAALVDAIETVFGEMDSTLQIAAYLIRSGLGVDTTITQSINDLDWDVTKESKYQENRLAYADIKLAYTNKTYDTQLPADQRVRLAQGILYDRKFADTMSRVSANVEAYNNASVNFAVQLAASRQASLTRLTYAVMAVSGVVVLIAFFGYWFAYVMIARHIKSKSNSIIKQHVEVPSAKRTARNFTIVSIVGSVIIVLFLISAFQLMDYSAGSAWRLQHAIRRGQFSSSVMFFGSELYETYRGFPHWSAELAASKDSGDLKLLQHINVIPTAVKLKRKLSELSASAQVVNDQMLFGDTAHPNYGNLGRTPEQTVLYFNTECLVNTYKTLETTGKFVPASACESRAFTKAHRGSGGLLVLYLRFIQTAQSLIDNLLDSATVDASVTASIEWMRQAIRPLSDLIMYSSSISTMELVKRFNLTITLNIVIFVFCSLLLATLFFAYAQRWIKDIALEEVRTKGMLDMIPEDAFVIDSEKDKDKGDAAPDATE